MMANEGENYRKDSLSQILISATKFQNVAFFLWLRQKLKI